MQPDRGPSPDVVRPERSYVHRIGAAVQTALPPAEAAAAAPTSEPEHAREPEHASERRRTAASLTSGGSRVAVVAPSRGSVRARSRLPEPPPLLLPVTATLEAASRDEVRLGLDADTMDFAHEVDVSWPDGAQSGSVFV